MSKGLETYKYLINLIFEAEEPITLNRAFHNEMEIIGEELKRLEELEKAFVVLSKDDEKAKKLLSKEIEKNRAFEIIKQKQVNVKCIMNGWGLGKYNSYKSHEKLTEEEYDLLKEVLCEQK